MPLHPSPLRSVETRERHRTRMTCCLPPRGAIANGCPSRKSYPLVAMAQSAQGRRHDDGCGWADGTLQPPRCPLWVKSGNWKTSRQCPLYPRKRTSEPARVFTFDAATPAAWRHSPRPAAPHLSRATWPPIAGPARPRSRCKRVAGRRDRARHSRRLIPRLTKAAGAAFAVNLDQTESTKRGGVVVTPGAEQVKG